VAPTVVDEVRHKLPATIVRANVHNAGAQPNVLFVLVEFHVHAHGHIPQANEAIGVCGVASVLTPVAQEACGLKFPVVEVNA